MTKAVISARLSAERLAKLDDACRKLGKNRSQVIDKGLELLSAAIDDKAELRYDPEWLRRSEANDGTEK